MKILYAAFFLTLFSWGELLLWKNGLHFPLTGFLLFYLAGAFSWKLALAGGILSGCALDFVAGNVLPIILLQGIAGILLSLFWLYKVKSDSVFLHIFPGGVLIVFAWCCALAEYGASFWKWGAVYPVAMLTLSIVPGVLFLPVMILLLDTLNENLGLPLYSNVKLHLREGEF